MLTNRGGVEHRPAPVWHTWVTTDCGSEARNLRQVLTHGHGRPLRARTRGGASFLLAQDSLHRTSSMDSGLCSCARVPPQAAEMSGQTWWARAARAHRPCCFWLYSYITGDADAWAVVGFPSCQQRPEAYDHLHAKASLVSLDQWLQSPQFCRIPENVQIPGLYLRGMLQKSVVFFQYPGKSLVLLVLNTSLDGFTLLDLRTPGFRSGA